jgi:hypothetical protein
MIKPRKVVVTIEMTSTMSIKDLKTEYSYMHCVGIDKIHQVQVNVIKEEKK